MTKSIEDELAGPLNALDKALERVRKTYVKFVHGMSATQRSEVFDFMQDRFETARDDMRRSEFKATPFSFGASVEPRGHERPAGHSFPPHARVPEQARTFDAPQQPTRPIGRLAKDSGEPGAGMPVISQPIRSPVIGGLVEPGIGFVDEASKDGRLT